MINFDPKLQRDVEANKASAVVYDRSFEGHYGTQILIIRIRPRKEGELNAYSEEVAPGWIVDFDENDQPFEIEILNPSAHFPREVLDLLPSEFIPLATKP